MAFTYKTNVKKITCPSKKNFANVYMVALRASTEFSAFVKRALNLEQTYARLTSRFERMFDYGYLITMENSY